jgi:cellulose synthase/poly-beta-1,6-N-acetylglucosamine synthase-like glycosyltransferase
MTTFDIVMLAVLVSLAVWGTFFVAYQLGLACSYFITKEDVPLVNEPRTRFVVVIPAHNEELMVSANLKSWSRVDYPKDLFDVIVIADNCNDNTGRIAMAEGARVLTRRDERSKGKGQALAWAFEHVDLKKYDAVVIVDADTVVNSTFLKAMNARQIQGAAVVQGYDGVLNPHQNAMTRVIQITNVVKNLLFNHAKSKLGLSVQLMGTGMCFNREVLEKIGWKAFSKGEDGEQFAYLAEEGVRVQYEPRAEVLADEASSLGQAYTQRIRWVSGRMQLVGLGLCLLLRGLKKRDLYLVDSSLTFLTPNYVELANLTVIGLVLSFVVPASSGGIFLLMWFSALLLGQTAYFFMGMRMTDCSFETVKSLFFVPVFMAWRGMVNILAIFHVRKATWVRTQRVSHGSTGEQAVSTQKGEASEQKETDSVSIR